MNNIFKKFFGFILFALIVSVFVPVQSVYSQTVTEFGGGRYYVHERIIENDLAHGLKQYTDISYSSRTLTEAYAPQQVNVLEVPTSSELLVVPWARVSAGAWNLATVRVIISDFEAKNPGYRVVAAINGDFFDINANRLFPRTPSGAHVALGEYYKTLTGRAIAFTNDGTANSIIGNGTPTRTSLPTLSVYDGEGNITQNFPINKVNQAPAEGEIALYFGTWTIETGWAAQRIVPIDVENAFIVKGGEYALPSTHRTVTNTGATTVDFYGIGAITQFGNAELTSSDFAIVSNNADVTAALDTGVRIRAQYGFTGQFAGAENVVGVGETILYDGVYSGADTNRHPRTMIGRRADGTIIMTVVDGRQESINMYGVTSSEMGAILKHYGCVDGYNLDGGGSSTLIILKDGQLEVMNSPSDGRERSDANGVLVAVRVPYLDYSVSDVVPTGLTINTDIVDNNGIQFDELYVKVNDVYQKIENGKAVFTGLSVFTNYTYSFYGKRGDDMFELFIEGITNTAKRVPSVNFVRAYYDGNDLVFDVSLSDVDSAITRRTVQIGNESASIINNRARFVDFRGDFLDDMRISLGYDLRDGVGRIDVEVTDFAVRLGMSVYLDVVRYRIKDSISRVYG